ncbi:uncharacterized protein LOC128882916 isoform X2 [Hylaeus volcanicus]|uniref:uncharacterized protein LOC128882916 isoform X2 n=1 Tax=Hylaeus volcanicus TaxID=313075 RepID=UPI0023B7DB22|nr:uncharacterized protein LOC128882916 isoform X2 [Hylaeus volcanicus]
MSQKIAASLTKKHILQSILTAIEENFGILGIGNVSRKLKVNDYRPVLNVFIIECVANHIDLLRSTLFFLTTINDIRVSISVLHVSGTLIQLKKAYTQYIISDAWRGYDIHVTSQKNSLPAILYSELCNVKTIDDSI